MSRQHKKMREAILAFVAHKRSLGYAYTYVDQELASLIELSAVHGIREPYLTEPLVKLFVLQGSKKSRNHRVSTIRNFGRFLAVEEPRTFVAPRRFLDSGRGRPDIRVLTRTEAAIFANACDSLPGARSSTSTGGLVHGTLLRTLLFTGLRLGEGRCILDGDVDLRARTLNIRRAKFGKARFVPIAPDLASRLAKFRKEIAHRFPGRTPADAFFPGPDGRAPASAQAVYSSFRTVLAIAGIEHGGRGAGPRIHDLRHTFAVLRLLAWYEAKVDTHATLPVLAAYLGHVGVHTTQTYLHMTTDLVAEISGRVEPKFGHIVKGA